MSDSTLIAIVAIIFGVGYGMYELKLKSVKSNQTGVKNDSLNDELEQLKQRVSVLEKIVTDKDYQLKQELEKL